MVDLVERTSVLILLRPGRDVARALPAMGRFSDEGGLILARTAPNQVLAMREGVDLPLMQELATLEPGASLIDLSDARVGVRIRGPETRAQLAHLLPLDLHPGRFGPGDCAQTLMAHLNVTVLQHGIDDYELQCGRSFVATFRTAMGMAPA